MTNFNRRNDSDWEQITAEIIQFKRKDTGQVEKGVKYTDPSGKEVIKSGGTTAWRNNNPGNITCAPDSKKYLKGTSKNHFCVG